MDTQEKKMNEVSQKKPYRKPQVIYKEPLEAMAAACTGSKSKTPNMPATCTPMKLFS